MHKNEEGVYTLLFFDKHGRHLKDKDQLQNTLTNSIDNGNKELVGCPEAVSFLVRRNVYNSIDHR